MKKVLFLIHSLGHGGAEKVLVNLVNNMDKTKFDVTVQTLIDSGVNKKYLSPDVRYLPGIREFKGNSKIIGAISPTVLYKLSEKNTISLYRIWRVRLRECSVAAWIRK